MGCITSKSSDHQQPNDPEIITNHQFISASNTNHAIDDLQKLIPPKYDHNLTVHTILKTNDALDRCSSFHTVEEYDELLQRISNHNDAELARDPVPVPDDSNIDTRDKEKQEMEFQTVASLKQWLHDTGGGDEDATINEYATPKVGFSFCENNSNDNSNNIHEPEKNSVYVKTEKQEEKESIVELVAAFDKYMQQLQIGEDNILKQIHHIIN